MESNIDKALELIKTTLTTGGDTLVQYDNVDRDVHINIRNSFRTVTVKEYPLNIESINILHWYDHSTSEDEWDGDYGAFAVFEYDKGFGVASHTGWWGPTFGEDQYDLDLHESECWENFDRLCLTDEMRELMPDLMIKMRLLRDNQRPT